MSERPRSKASDLIGKTIVRTHETTGGIVLGFSDGTSFAFGVSLKLERKCDHEFLPQSGSLKAHCYKCGELVMRI